mgnify:CR=1 FL=1
MKLKKSICWLVFKTIGNLMPESSSVICGNIFGSIRACFLKGFIEHCGKHVNIDKHSIVSTHLKIDDYSGIRKKFLHSRSCDNREACDDGTRLFNIYGKS